MDSSNFPSERSVAELIKRSNRNIVYGALAKTSLLLAASSSTRADVFFDKDYVPDFTKKDQGPEALMLSMGASHELQRAFQRLHPGPRAFVSTNYSFS